MHVFSKKVRWHLSLAAGNWSCATACCQRLQSPARKIKEEGGLPPGASPGQLCLWRVCDWPECLCDREPISFQNPHISMFLKYCFKFPVLGKFSKYLSFPWTGNPKFHPSLSTGHFRDHFYHKRLLIVKNKYFISILHPAFHDQESYRSEELVQRNSDIPGRIKRNLGAFKLKCNLLKVKNGVWEVIL